MISQNVHYIPIFTDDEIDVQKSELSDIPKVFQLTISAGQICTENCLVTKSFHLKVYH